MATEEKNKRIDETNFQRAVEELKKSIGESKETRESISKSFNTLISPIANFFKDYKATTKQLADKIGNFDFTNALTGGLDAETQRIDSKYSNLRNGVNNDKNLSQAQKDFYNTRYNSLEEEEKESAYDESIFGKTSKKVSTEFSRSLTDMLTGYKSFSDVMKDMTGNLTDYMVKQFTDAISNLLFNETTTKALSTLLGGILDLGTGGLGSAFGFIGSLFSKHHSGGMVPSGANYSLPGTQEQLALLKGGERILSPGENVSYENQGGSSPIIVNTFNVKAWDSKDVSKYLLENKQLLNQITYEGIKNNNSHLRHIVQNA